VRGDRPQYSRRSSIDRVARSAEVVDGDGVEGNRGASADQDLDRVVDFGARELQEFSLHVGAGVCEAVDQRLCGVDALESEVEVEGGVQCSDAPFTHWGLAR
jgi:hypothetical protein